MTDNGANNWGVTYGRITFFEQILRNHQNVERFTRTKDILFQIERKRERDQLIALCVDEYTFGMAMAHRALDEFGHLDLIFVGGKWNHPDGDAKAFLRSKRIGIYNAKDINGALQSKLYWKYDF